MKWSVAVTGVCLLGSLACSGAMESAKKRASDKIAHEAGEQLAKRMLGAESVNVDANGDMQLTMPDGSKIQAGQQVKLPATWPAYLAPPAGSGQQAVMEMSEAVMVTYTAPGTPLQNIDRILADCGSSCDQSGMIKNSQGPMEIVILKLADGRGLMLSAVNDGNEPLTMVQVSVTPAQ